MVCVCVCVCKFYLTFSLSSAKSWSKSSGSPSLPFQEVEVWSLFFQKYGFLNYYYEKRSRKKMFNLSIPKLILLQMPLFLWSSPQNKWSTASQLTKGLDFKRLSLRTLPCKFKVLFNKEPLYSRLCKVKLQEKNSDGFAVTHPFPRNNCHSFTTFFCYNYFYFYFHCNHTHREDRIGQEGTLR